MEDVNYYARCLKFGTLEFSFNDEETAYTASLNPIENETWMLFPIYMEKRLMHLRINGVPPEFRPEWLVAAALDDAEGPYNVVTMCRAETVPM